MPNIHHRILIAAATDKVFDAIAQQNGLRGWWTPGAVAQPLQNTVARFEFEDGYIKEMRITALRPASYIAWQCISGADEWTGTNISFRILPADATTLLSAHPEMAGQLRQQPAGFEGSLLVFQHEGWQGYTPMFAECSYTWALFLRSLKLWCETGKGLPWPGQHLH